MNEKFINSKKFQIVWSSVQSTQNEVTQCKMDILTQPQQFWVWHQWQRSIQLFWRQNFFALFSLRKTLPAIALFGLNN